MGPDRKLVWIALSELFLDTDVRLNFIYAADKLAASPYSIEELKQILDKEVTPALQVNLLQVAGDWAGFPEDWVVDQVMAVIRRPWLHPRLINVTHHWEMLAQLIVMISRYPAQERETRVQALRSLTSLLLSNFGRPAVCEHYPIAELERMFRTELWPVLIDSCRSLAQDSPGSYPSEQEIEENWRQYVIAHESAQWKSEPPSPE